MGTDEKLELLLEELERADAVIVGAGDELSRAGGLAVDAGNDAKRLGRDPGRYWAVYAAQLKSALSSGVPACFSDLSTLLGEHKFHALTTSADGMLARALGPERVTHMRGDWGALQCSRRCHDALYPASDVLDGVLSSVKDGRVPADAVPKCPECGEPLQPWVYGFSFLEGERHRSEYAKWNTFLKEHINSRILFFEVGLGTEAPEFIKMPFWQMAQQHPDCAYVALEPERAFAPSEIEDLATTLDGDLSALPARAVELGRA